MGRWRFRLEGWSWVVVPAAIAIASRIFSAVLVTVIASGSPDVSANHGPFIAWDGAWYLGIAQFGYHAAPVQEAINVGHHDFAFYPGWPLLIRTVSLGGILPFGPISVVLANGLFVLAAVVVYALFRERFSERTALWGILLLAFNPVSYVFSMAYSEGLFVLIAALYFVDRYGRASPLLAGLSVLVRVAGLAIGASAAVMFVLNRANRFRLALICLAVGFAFACWWIYLWWLTGRFDGWLLGSTSWDQYEGFASIVRQIQTHPLRELARGGFVLLMIAGCVLLLRRHLDMAVYGLVAIALSLIGAPAWSMPRHAMVGFPVFGVLADRLGPRWSALLLIVFVVGEAVFVSFAFVGTTRQPP